MLNYFFIKFEILYLYILKNKWSTNEYRNLEYSLIKDMKTPLELFVIL